MKSILTLIALFFVQILLAQTTILIEENFNDDQLDPAITFNPNLEGVSGRVQISNKVAVIGKYTDGTGFTRNSIDIAIDLKDKSDILLFFFINDNFDENHSQDGLFLSNNGGADFTKVYDFKAETWCNNIWGNFQGFDIDRLAEKAGLPFTENFVLRIQQYDNADFNINNGGDGDGFYIDNIVVYSRDQNYAELPFEDNFNNAINGLLGDSWHPTFADLERPELTQFVTPMGYIGINSGEGTGNSKGVAIGKRANCHSGATVNALDLRLNLEGESDVFMYFDMREIYDETHDEDGLFLSNDGGRTFKKAYDFEPETWCNNIWGNFPPFSLDRLAEETGVSFSDEFVVRFQQFDDADFNLNAGGDADGLFIDNVFVYSRPPVYADLPFEEYFENTSPGQIGRNWQRSHADDTNANLTPFVRPHNFIGTNSGWGINNSKGLLIGKRANCHSGMTVNAFDLFVNSENCTDMKLDFVLRRNYEENNPEDGIFFSNNGGNSFEKIYDFQFGTLPNNLWLQYSLDMDKLLADVGLTASDKSVIRFQQYDDADFNLNAGGDADGIALDNILVYCDASTDVEKIESSNQVSIYPNPVTDDLVLEFENYVSEGEAKIYNAQGRLLMNYPLTGNKTILNFSHISPGIHFLKIITKEDETITRKFIKK